MPGQLLATQIEQKLSAHVIGPWLDLGFFNWYSTAKPLNSYGDLKGLKIRNSGGAGQAWRTQFMGAIPNTTPLPNVALALSQGTFDGLITTNETVASAHSGNRESAMRSKTTSSSANTFRSSVSPSGRSCRPIFSRLLTDLWRENVAAYRAEHGGRAVARARADAGARDQRSSCRRRRSSQRSGRKMMADQDQVAKLSKISPEMIAAVSAELADAG